MGLECQQMFCVSNWKRAYMNNWLDYKRLKENYLVGPFILRDALKQDLCYFWYFLIPVDFILGGHVF